MAISLLLGAAWGLDGHAEAGTSAETSPPTDPSADLVAGAQEEGNVTWYTSLLLVEEAEPLAAAFEEEYGIEVEIFRAGGGDTVARFAQEAAAGVSSADIVSASDPVAFNVWAREGLLEQFVPSQFDQVPEFARHEEGYWVGTLMRMTVIGYRSDQEEAAEMPTSWEDLADPMYAGKIVIGDPAFSGATGALWAQLERDYGEEYIEALHANEVLLVEGAGALNDIILIGERTIGGNMGLEVIHQMQADGAAVEAVIPEEGSFAVPTATAIAANAPHPNAAKLFAEFLLSDSGQNVLASVLVYPVRLDVGSPEGLPSYDEVQLYEVDWDYFEQVRDEFIERFGEIFG